MISSPEVQFQYLQKFIRKLQYNEKWKNGFYPCMYHRKILIILLEQNIAFLKEQINRKDKVIDSLLNQLSKKNDSTPHKKTCNTKANTVSIQTEVTADSKSTNLQIKLKGAIQKEYGMKTKIRHTSIQNNLHHYTKVLTMHLLKKTLTIANIINRLTAVTSIQKVRNP